MSFSGVISIVPTTEEWLDWAASDGIKIGQIYVCSDGEKIQITDICGDVKSVSYKYLGNGIIQVQDLADFCLLQAELKELKQLNFRRKLDNENKKISVVCGRFAVSKWWRRRFH